MTAIAILVSCGLSGWTLRSDAVEHIPLPCGGRLVSEKCLYFFSDSDERLRFNVPANSTDACLIAN